METVYKMNAKDLGASFVASVQSVYLDRNIEITIREVVAANDEAENTDDSWFEKGEPCPICAKHRDPVTGEPRFNAETVAAIEEGRAMMRGEIPATWYNSIDEMWEDLMKEDADD